MGTDSVFPIGRGDDLSASNAQVTTRMLAARATWHESLRYGANQAQNVYLIITFFSVFYLKSIPVRKLV